MPANIPFTRRGLLGSAAAAMSGVLLGPQPAASALTVPQTPNVPEARAVPRRYTRAEWAARPPTAAATVLNRAPDHIVVHHTASANAADLSLAHAFTLSRAIQNFHMDSNGWEDAGQQLTISRGGHLMEGRNRSLAAIDAGDLVVGAQTLGHNDHTIGIENEGTYMTEEPTEALWDALVATCAWLCDVHGLDPREAIVGHRDYNTTACPGDALYAQLPRLRNEVAGNLGLRRRVRESPPPKPSGLPGPRHTFDHGPAA
ncbi:peptidoglycan recognition family protein [Actinomadura sp. 1N219]|uniref:peptidoglycan recognition family protein n=1 Tax=Actinomadura sp. 1N219 TaxID=3375152 RepID=UPI0037A9FA24